MLHSSPEHVLKAVDRLPQEIYDLVIDEAFEDEDEVEHKEKARYALVSKCFRDRVHRYVLRTLCLNRTQSPEVIYQHYNNNPHSRRHIKEVKSCDDSFNKAEEASTRALAKLLASQLENIEWGWPASLLVLKDPPSYEKLTCLALYGSRIACWCDIASLLVQTPKLEELCLKNVTGGSWRDKDALATVRVPDGVAILPKLRELALIPSDADDTHSHALLEGWMAGAGIGPVEKLIMSLICFGTEPDPLGIAERQRQLLKRIGSSLSKLELTIEAEDVLWATWLDEDTFSANTKLSDLYVYSAMADIPRPSSFMRSIRSEKFVNAQFFCVKISHMLEWGRMGEFRALETALKADTLPVFSALELATMEKFSTQDNKELQDTLTQDMPEWRDLLYIRPCRV